MHMKRTWIEVLIKDIVFVSVTKDTALNITEWKKRGFKQPIPKNGIKCFIVVLQLNCLVQLFKPSLVQNQVVRYLP